MWKGGGGFAFPIVWQLKKSFKTKYLPYVQIDLQVH